MIHTALFIVLQLASSGADAYYTERNANTPLFHEDMSITRPFTGSRGMRIAYFSTTAAIKISLPIVLRKNSNQSTEMYFDSDKDSLKYKAHYCSACACMLRIASQDARARHNAARRARHQAYLDCGLKRVRGANGGVYYE